MSCLHAALDGEGLVFTTGLVLQELWQGFRGPRDGREILDHFGALPLVAPDREDHVEAAALYLESPFQILRTLSPGIPKRGVRLAGSLVASSAHGETLRFVTHDHSLFDDYLDACLAGEAPPVESFLAEHPEAGAEVREKIRALHHAWSGTQENALPFERIAGYRLLHPLDTGGMGAVYVAEQESLGRVVALKLMRPSWAGVESAERRFAREAQAVAQLRHPGIVTVFESGVDGDTRYLAMEMVPGRMLSDILSEAAMNGTPVPVDRIARWGANLARALDYAHGRGIVHRDVKPENIRITPDDAPMLLDFGIAVDLTGSTTTVTRTFQGSPAYAAPEQIRKGLREVVWVSAAG